MSFRSWPMFSEHGLSGRSASSNEPESHLLCGCPGQLLLQVLSKWRSVVPHTTWYSPFPMCWSALWIPPASLGSAGQWWRRRIMYKTRLKILQRIQVGELVIESPKRSKMNIAGSRKGLQKMLEDCREVYLLSVLRTRATCCSALVYLSRLSQSSLVSPEYCILFHCCIILKGCSFYAV